MQYFSARSLRRQMVLYFAFIAVVFLTLAVELTMFLNGPEVRGAIGEAARAVASGGGAAVAVEPLDRVLVKLAAALVILLVTISLVLTLFMKRVTIPLEKILAGVGAISAGDLSVTIPVYTRDELGRIATCVNGLAANYQEVLLLVRQQVGLARQALGSPGHQASGSNASTQVDEILDELEAIVAEFGREYYQGSGSR